MKPDAGLLVAWGGDVNPNGRIAFASIRPTGDDQESDCRCERIKGFVLSTQFVHRR
jgi:hypothetical protein